MSILLALLAPVLLAVLPVPPAPAAPVPAERDLPRIAPAKPLLDGPQRGRAAIRRLGEHLEVAAARNDLRTGELRELLLTDSTAWVDPDGMLLYVDPAPEQAAGVATASAGAPLSETFGLHSNPGANLTVLLDFDGATVSGTGWNNAYGVTAGSQPAWDPAGDGPAFSDSERLKVQQVWAMVAEDYAPFEVDVTTEDRGDALLVRSSSDDPVYGTRVLVTPADDPFAKICQRGCGGVAYVGVFDRLGSYNQPAWVFPQALGNNAKSVAEAASHEAGHNLGLNHDGTGTQGYYAGHGIWAPIMGVGYQRPLVQWSRGSYPGANNGQDDLQILRGYLGSRTDEAPASPATPAILPEGEAVVGSPGDVDAYLLGTCAADTVVEVLPAAVAPDLDLRAVLYDAAGVQRAVAQPASGPGNGTTAAGLGAALTVPADGDGWVVTTEGVGAGEWSSSGYDDYGSLGVYTVSAPGCDGRSATGVPGAPADVTAASDATDRLTLRWSPPTATGGGPVTGYVVSRSGSATSENLGADARSHTFAGLAAGTEYQLGVRALNASGPGPSVILTASTMEPVPAAPSAPRDVTGSYHQVSKALQIWWTEPTSTGTQPLLGYDVFLDGANLGRLGPTSRGADVTRQAGFAEGQYVVGVAAVSAAGRSPVATVTITVDLPDRPANDDVANAEVLNGITGSVQGDNTWATREATDPTPPGAASGAGGRSVWYSWTPAESGAVSMATSAGGAGRDTTLAVYTGQPGVLVQVAGDDSTGTHAQVVFEATAGTRYLVAVDGFAAAGGTGPFTLGWWQGPARAPAAPVGVAATPRDTSAVVSWTAPDAHGSPITRYTVFARAAGRSDRTAVVDGSTTSVTVAGLANGTTYTVTVVAVNAVGASPESAPASVVPDVADPAAPEVSGFAASARKVDYFFHSGAVTVRVRLSDDQGIAGTPVLNIGPTTATEETYDRSAPLTLVRGTRRDGIWTASYVLTWPVMNGPYSAWTAVSDTAGNTTRVRRGENRVLEAVTDLWLGTPPPVPGNVHAVSGDGRARVSWSAPDASVTDYTVWVTPGVESFTVAGDRLSTVIGGLANDVDHSFTVVAGNAVGESPESAPSNPVTPTRTPSRPTGVRATGGDGHAVVTWEHADYLAQDVASYEITAAAVGGGTVVETVPAASTSARVSGLRNGTTYTFAVRALRDAGASLPSEPSDPVTPMGPPLRPAPPVATRGDAWAVVTWAAAEANGSPVTGYRVTASPGGRTCASAEALSCTVHGLSSGTSYTFTVTASNAAGESEPSEPSEAVAPPATAPSRMPRPTVVVRGARAVVTWAAAAANGSAVTRYLVDLGVGRDRSTVGSARRTVFSRLRPGWFKVRVAARNGVGTSPYSAWVRFRIR